MKLSKRLLTLLLVLCLMLSLGTVSYAKSYTGDATVPGLSKILPEDSLTLPRNTVWATLPASWGVRVSFVDWDESLLKTELVPVTETSPGSSSAPEDPTRTGYTFTGWERHDTNDGPATLNKDGTVTGVNGPGPIVFIATYVRDVGGLVVSKTIAGNAADSAKAFDFTVKLGDTSINGTYGGMSFKDGVASFSLKGGESKTAEGLPAGTSYAVTEADYSKEGYETSKTGDTGTIVKDETAAVKFTNTKNVQYGNLTIRKTVTGDEGDRTKYFSFTVTFNAEGSYSYTGSKSGTVKSGSTVQLKHGESITIHDLPAGAEYSVKESGNAGYRVHASGNTGKIIKNGNVTAAFTNAKGVVPVTGEDNRMLLGLSLMGAAVLGVVGTLCIANKKRRKAAQLKNR